MKYLRNHKEILTEILVYTLYVVVVVCAFWWLSSSHSALAKLFDLTDTVELTLDSISSMLGIAAAAMAIIISNRQQAAKEQQAARDQIYQQLELESVSLFRFEIENVDIARLLWDNDEITYDALQKDKNKAYQVLQHTCQVLNLFEMAVRFKKNGVAHVDVFASWEAWIFDLCQSELFLHYWYLEGLKENYIGLFQTIVDAGLLHAHGKQKVDAVMLRIDNTHDSKFKAFRAAMKQCLE